MSVAMNGKNFERQLVAASTKLQRAAASDEGFDPSSGFSAQEIVDFAVLLPEMGDEEQLAKAKAVLRRNGFAEEASSFAV